MNEAIALAVIEAIKALIISAEAAKVSGDPITKQNTLDAINAFGASLASNMAAGEAALAAKFPAKP